MWVRFPVDSLPEGPPRFASPYGAKSRGGTLEAAAALAGLRISMEGGGSGGGGGSFNTCSPFDHPPLSEVVFVKQPWKHLLPAMMCHKWHFVAAVLLFFFVSLAGSKFFFLFSTKS